MQQVRRFARYWDLVGNSGNFVETTPVLLGAGTAEIGSAFGRFMRWSDWLHARIGRTDSIALVRLMELLFTFLTGELGLQQEVVAPAMWRDYQRGGRRDKPGFLKDLLPAGEPETPRPLNKPMLPKRQARHLQERV